ncbi:hypothetical protein C7964_102331 [Loktanella sp. PT4BL]|uniref:hypothetical protein n=1 Tax=Loktanella sp. PT4BL TaxID=2135611 RepID=UPI000D75C5E8|nr:hypothetical protein [Loktanella sp. PT4BL]PXW70444.1 hypothetical protein C7964_102331 [Loktanella sp. PT4BL]
MIGHNSNPKLVAAASEINTEHKGMLAAIEDSETRARRIGQVLIDLKPVLKETGVNLTDFCKEHLPFGKTAAYEFISIAKGKVTLQELNARKYSAPAEKLTAHNNSQYRGPSEEMAQAIRDLAGCGDDMEPVLEAITDIIFDPENTKFREARVHEWLEKAFDGDDNGMIAELNFLNENKDDWIVEEEAKSRADQIREDLSKLTPDEQLEYLGGPQKFVDQEKLDNKLEENFVPYNAALTVLNSLNRLRIYGGKAAIIEHVRHALDTSVRFQPYEAEALVLLAEAIMETKDELQAMYQTKPDLNKLN